MNLLIRKEVRMILPAWVAAIILTIAPLWFIAAVEQTAFYSTIGLGLGLGFLGLSPFGQEFNFGTFGLLLSQPISRQRIWLVKISVLILAVLSVAGCLCAWLWLRFSGLHFLQQQTISNWQVLALLSFMLITGGLWSTMLLRQASTAIWITLLTPWVLWLVLLQFVSEARISLLAPTLIIIYGITGLLWARHQFLHAEDRQHSGETLEVPGYNKLFSWVQPATHRTNPIMALFRKELQMHQGVLPLAGIAGVLHIAAIVRAKMIAGDPNYASNYTSVIIAGGLWFIWGCALPGIIGSTAVAEERKLKTAEAQMCLPVGQRTQWLIKWISVLFLTTIISGVIPLVLTQFDPSIPARMDVVPAYACTALFVLIVSFYSSTLAQNTLQALEMTVILGSALVMIFQFSNWLAPSRILWVPVMISVATIIMLWLGYRNTRRVTSGWQIWAKNILILASVLGISYGATATIYNRPWEAFLNLEPHHGPRRIASDEKPHIGVSENHCHALMPDGRLWVIRIPVPQKGFPKEKMNMGRGHFLAKSNWVAVVTSENFTMLGLQQDGSLWRMGFPNSPTDKDLPIVYKRVGDENDWKAISGRAELFCGLKKSGAVSVILPGTDAIMAMNPSFNFSNFLATSETPIAVKQDGTLWQFSYPWNYTITNHALPASFTWKPCSLPGTNWLSIAASFNILAVRADGTLWGFGKGSRYLEEAFDKSAHPHERNDWQQVAVAISALPSPARAPHVPVSRRYVRRLSVPARR